MTAEKINQMSSLDTFVRSWRNRKFANVVSLGTKLLFSSKHEKRWREKSSAKSPGYNVFEKMKRRSIVIRGLAISNQNDERVPLRHLIDFF